MSDLRNVKVGDQIVSRIIDLSLPTKETFGDMFRGIPEGGCAIIFDSRRLSLWDIPHITMQNVDISKAQCAAEWSDKHGYLDSAERWPTLMKVKAIYEKYGIVKVTVQATVVAEPEPKLDATCTELDANQHIRPTDDDYWYKQYWHLRSVLRQAVNRHKHYKGKDTAEIAQDLLNDQDVEKGIRLFYNLLEEFHKNGFQAGYEMAYAEETTHLDEGEPDPTPTSLHIGGFATGGPIPAGANPPEIIFLNDTDDNPKIPEVLRQILENLSNGGLQPIGVVKIA